MVEENNKLFELAMDCRNLMVANGFNPIEAMVEVAQNTEDPYLKFKASKELAGYFAPRMGSLKNAEANEETKRSLYLQINNYRAEAIPAAETKSFEKKINKLIQENNAS